MASEARDLRRLTCCQDSNAKHGAAFAEPESRRHRALQRQPVRRLRHRGRHRMAARRTTPAPRRATRHDLQGHGQRHRPGVRVPLGDRGRDRWSAMTESGPIRHALVHANRSTCVLPANPKVRRRTLRNVDPNRDVWLRLGRKARVGAGIHLPPLAPAFETTFKGDIFAITDRPTLMYDSTDVHALLGTPGLAGADLLVPGRPGVSAPAEMVFGYHDGAGKWGEPAWRMV